MNAFFHYRENAADYTMDPIGIGLIFSITLLSGWLAEFFWPRDSLRPTSVRGALMGAIQSSFYSALLLYYSFNCLSSGTIRCFGRGRRYRGCGVEFFDGNSFRESTENLLSLGYTPHAFWFQYFFVFCITLVFLAWFFVCVRAIRERKNKKHWVR